MNLRRGLIRLWVLASAIWVAGIVTVAASDPNIQRAAEPANPYAGLAEPDPAQAKPEAAETAGDWWKNDPVVQEAPAQSAAAATGSQDWWKNDPGVVAAARAPATWKYAGIAFGVPIVLLVFGAGVWWVASGFRSDAPRNARPEMPPDPDAATWKIAARNRRRWRILLPFLALLSARYFGDELAAIFFIVALLPRYLG